MSEFSVSADWLEADDIQGAELRSTWCSLTLRIGDSVPTRVFSHRSRTVRDDVVLPAYPLAEWLATSWWRLFEQRENPLRASSTAFLESHSLRYAREGYALPDLTLVSQGEACRLTWSGGRLEPYGVEFLSSGRVMLPTTAVRDCLREFIDQVVGRLVDSGVEGTLLQEEWAAVQSVDGDEAAYCAALASVGMDPFAVDEEQGAVVVEAYESLPEALVKELSAVADGPEIGPAAERVAELVKELRQGDLSLGSPQAIRATLQQGTKHVTDPTPWATGYAQARALRAQFELNGAAVGSLARLAELLGEENDDVHAMAAGHDLGLALVNGVASTTDDGAFALRLASAHANTTLFNFSRALGGYLFGVDESIALTRASSDTQSRLRAFAAEFLAPSAALKTAISGETVDQDEVEEIAGAFGVSPILIHHQLQNHGIANTSMQLVGGMPDV